MKVQMTYNGKTVEVEVADEQFEKLFAAENKKTGYEPVEYDEQYWYVNSIMDIVSDCQGWHTKWDNMRYESVNYFSDKTVAEDMARAQCLWNRIHRRAVELCEPIYQRKDGSLYTICFDPQDNRIFADNWIIRRFGEIYFDTEEHGNHVINEFHDDLLWYFTEFKDRADM